MYPKSGHPAQPKPTQSPVIQMLKKYGHFTQPISNILKNVGSTGHDNEAPQTKNNSIVMYQKCPHTNKNVNKMNKNNVKHGTPIKAGTQIIYKRCNHEHKINSRSDNTNTKVAPVVMKTIKTASEPSKSSQKSVQKDEVNSQSKSQEKGSLVETPKLCPRHSNKIPAQPQNSNNANRSPQQKPPAVESNNKEINNQLNKTKEPKQEEKSSQKKVLVELYSKPIQKRTQGINLNPGSLNTTENLNFQRVTQELANIIKNFQKQIHDVPMGNGKVDEIASEILQPKIKEFFKTPKQPSSDNTSQEKDDSADNTNNLVPTNKTQTQSSVNNNINKQSSLRSLSSSASSRSRDVRRFRSFTHHELSMRCSSSSRKVINRASSLGVDPLKQLKDEVQRAIREKKTFTVRGQYQPIRKALLARGWVEKYHVSYKDQVSGDLKRYQNYTISELLPLTRREDLTAMCRNLIKSKLLGGYQVDFYWGINDEAFKENPDKIKLTIINKLKREIFSYTNKQGLCDSSKSSYWYQKTNVSKLNHPRTYTLGKNGDLHSFIDDFHMTAAMSLLKWVVKMYETKECKLMSPCGSTPLETFDFALNECCKFIKRQRHEDIDTQIPDAKDHEWSQFLDYFYKLVHYNNHFKAQSCETEESLVRKSNYVLNTLRSVNPYLDMDGMMNIWILKPTASSRGRGIHMCRTVQYVLKTIKQNPNTRYIIQKYIERPLLIYNTKFDIRQWFLISNCSPMTIWMYKESYLRFSSQTYNLRKLHESIHLTNNSVQCKYKNNFLDSALPNYNMWDSTEFQKYLSNIGYPRVFNSIIYPGMKQCITAAVLMHQEKMVVRKNCFELYGADFILTEDFHPWLLEINSSPALYASTPVTAKMCPQVLEDVIKVVVDYTHNVKADTGSFEMVYKEQLAKLPAEPILELQGKPLQNNYFFNTEESIEKFTPPPPAKSPVAMNHTQDCLKMFGEEIKKTLKNLLQIIHNEKQKRCLQNRQTENLKTVAC